MLHCTSALSTNPLPTAAAMPPAGTFKRTHDFAYRHSQTAAQRATKPSLVPLIIEHDPSLTTSSSSSHTSTSSSKRGGLPDFPKGTPPRLWVAADATVGHVLYALRTRLALKPAQALFLYAGDGTDRGGGGVLVPTAMDMARLDEEFRDEDGNVYLVYAAENTFG